MKKHVLAVAFAVSCGAAQAGEAGDILTRSLYAGDYGAGLDDLAPLVETGESEALFADGMLRFLTGMQSYMQAMYRHGLSAPQDEILFEFMELPSGGRNGEPPDHEVEPLDYQGYRDILEEFVIAMDAARDSFVAAGDAGDFVVPVDIFSIRIDGDGDGEATESETIRELFVAAATAAAGTLGEDPDDLEGMPGDFIVGFDNADAYWLSGYGQVFTAQADFMLAHDFQGLSDVFFHRMFPMAGFPMQDFGGASDLGLLSPEGEAFVADLVAAVHEMNFPVIDPERLRGVRQRLLSITDFSRRSWDAILAETDDDHELVSSPDQTPFTDHPVEPEMIEAWRSMLDTVDRILEGELLLPHWRFERGFDLKAYFETAERTDLVMILTGYGALPFLADGPIVTTKHFAKAMEVFGEDFAGYLIWFN